MLHSIEEEEEIICNLEKLDHTFATIKSNLRIMRMKLGALRTKSQKLSADLQPWIRFFDVDGASQTSPPSEVYLSSMRITKRMDSSDIMLPRAPGNPFAEPNSSPLPNKELSRIISQL